MSRRKLWLMHGGIVLGCLALLLFWRCPIRLLTGFACPGCGVTRAFFAALRLDFSGAFALHPLFWLAPFLVLIPVHIRPLSRRIPSRVLWAVTAGIAVLFTAVYIVRLIQGDPVVAPNPQETIWYKLGMSIMG